MGLARFELGAKPGASLTVVLPREGEALAAEVDGESVRPLQGDKNHWIISLDQESPPREVVLLWRAKAEPGDRGVFEAPGLFTKKVPTLLTIDLPENFRLQPLSVESVACSAAVLEIERLERGTRRLAETAARSKREVKVGDFVAIELLARDADRAVARIEPPPRTVADVQARKALSARIKAARARFEEWADVPAARDALHQARVKVGLAVESSSRTSTSVEPSVEPLRLRRVGRSVSFRAEGPGHGLGLPLEWTREPATNSARNVNIRLALAVCALFGASVWSLVKLGKRPVRLGLVAIVAVALAPLYASVEWPASIAWLLLVALGRVLKR